MQEIRFLNIRGSTMDMAKLIGALVAFAGLLGVIMSLTTVFETTKNIKGINSCIIDAKLPESLDIAQDRMSACQQQSVSSLGVYPRATQDRLTLSQLLTVIFTPIIASLFWLATVFVGGILYQTGKIFLPLSGLETTKFSKLGKLSKIRKVTKRKIARKKRR